MSTADQAPVVVYRGRNSVEAHIVVQALEDEGIYARVASTALENVIGKIPYQGPICPVWVHEVDRARALEIIRHHESQRGQDIHISNELFCYYCGETLAEQVGSCPACHAQLSWA